jgi:1,4-alpha-glucan branching enzyme
MIKRTTNAKNTATRATLTKASPVKIGAGNIEATNREPMKTQAPQNAKPSPVKALPTAHLELVKPEAKSVCVAGSFNEWNPVRTPLTKLTDGKWVGELSGISGRHEYLFVVDGQWLPDPNARESVQNPFGGRNSVLIVSE